MNKSTLREEANEILLRTKYYYELPNNIKQEIWIMSSYRFNDKVNIFLTEISQESSRN